MKRSEQGASFPSETPQDAGTDDAGSADTVSTPDYTTPALPGIPQNCGPRAWLERFPAARRSAIANWYHYAVRAGHSKPASVVHQVHQEVQRRLRWVSDPTEEAHLRTILE